VSTPANRNVLYGLLAFQLGFVDRQTLLALLQTWTASKSRRLGDILTEQNIVPASVRDLLDALVEEHLRIHDGSPEKSLAALSSVGSIRADLELLGDSDLNATLGHVPADTTQPGVSRAHRITAVGPQSDGRFRVVKMHAKGGLGQVSLAVDEELSREVALKELQGKFADDEQNRIRFVMEAEITGGLEHPGIVPVYGAGHYADGRPFYAMRFVRGDSLHDAVQAFHERRTHHELGGDYDLELRKLLQRFIDVCDAIEYAHSRGVLHRDLKPGNIMLGRYGETLVVDWGLAKPLGRREPHSAAAAVPEDTLLPVAARDSVPTQMGSAVGTPHYMSPEQAAGRLGDLGPSSDVYSLGATLYCLLTGEPPFQGQNVAEILAAVQFGSVKSPRQINPRISKSLEAACLKAMARAPDERYDSPRGLAEDIELWLADQSISAYREPLHVRTGRWLRKHRMVAGSGLSALAVALVSALVIAGLLADSNQKLADEQSAAVAARDDAIAARNEATALAGRNEELALEAQRQVAQTYRSQATRLLEGGDISSGLPWLIRSIDAIPPADASSRDLAVDNLAAWCQNKIALKRAIPANHLYLLPLEGTGRILAGRFIPAEKDSEEPWTYGSMSSQLLDAETLHPISPWSAPSFKFGDYEFDAKNDIFCAVIYDDFEVLEPSKVELLPAALEITEENRDRLVITVEGFELRRCTLSEGQPIGKPLRIRQRTFGFEAVDDGSYEPNDDQEANEPILDEFVGFDLVSGFVVMRNCTTNETEVWSMNTGESVDVELPSGPAQLSKQSILAIRTDEGEIRFFKIPSGEETGKPLIHEQPVTAFKFSTTGDHITTVTEDGKLHGWTLKNGIFESESVSEETIVGPLHSMEAAGNKILTINEKGFAQLWLIHADSRTVRLIRSSQVIPETEVGSISTARFTDDQGSHVVIETNETLELWNPVVEPDLSVPSPPSMSQPVVFSLRQSNMFRGISWDLKGNYCATYADNKLTLWRVDGHDPIQYENTGTGRVTDLSLSLESNRLATVSDDGVIRIWDLEGNLLAQSANAPPGQERTSPGFLYGQTDWLTTIEQPYDEDEIPSEQVLQIWEVPARRTVTHNMQVVSGEENPGRPPVPPAPIAEEPFQERPNATFWRAKLGFGGNNMRVSPDGQSLVSCREAFDVSRAGSKIIRFVPVAVEWTRYPERDITPGYFEIFNWPVADSATEKVGSLDYAGRLEASRIRVSPDGERVALARLVSVENSINEELLVQFWSIPQNKPLGPIIKIDRPTKLIWREGDDIRTRPGQVVVAFDSSVQKFVAGESRRNSAQSAEADNKSVDFHVWDLSTGKPVGKALSHADEVLCAAFSPDDKVLATGSEDGTIKLWDANSGEPLREPLRDVAGVRAIFFSPDGDRLLSVTSAGTWRTWQLSTGKAVLPPISLQHDGWIVAEVSPDGTTLFTGGSGGQVQQWDISSGLAIGPPQRFSGEIDAIKAGPDFLAVQSKGGWHLIQPYNVGSELAERVKLWADTVAAVRLEETDRVQRLTPEEISRVNQRLEELGGPPTDEFQLPEVFLIY